MSHLLSHDCQDVEVEMFGNQRIMPLLQARKLLKIFIIAFDRYVKKEMLCETSVCLYEHNNCCNPKKKKKKLK